MKLLNLFTGILLCVICQYAAMAQTKVSGKIADGLTNEPIPFANVAFKGTSIGTISDINGKYTIETTKPVDTLAVSYIGYQPVELPVQRGKTQTKNVFMKVSKVELKEVVVVPGENPANVLFRKLLENKPRNDKAFLDAYKYEVYNKVEFDLSNISEEFKKKKFIKPFAFVFENIDSSESNRKPFLPIFISETLSDFYFTKNPKNEKELIRASKVSGVENATVTQFLGDMYQNTNVYENFINIFGKSFVSPASDIGLTYYRYYLVDSAFIDNQWCYKLSFQPRRKQELTFLGDFWVHDSTFAIRKLTARIASDANINFVEDLAVVREYKYVNNNQWMLSKEQLVVDFAAREDGMSIIGRKTSSYRDFVLNDPKSPEFFTKGEDIVFSEDAIKKDENFWAESRHDSLSERERKIYAMVDTIQSLPVFQTYVDIITLFVTGYYEYGKFEFGPYFTTYSFNNVEGNRIRLGGRTGNNFSTNIIFNGYVAYGTRDNEFKYSSGVQYFLSKKPRQSVGFSYKDDVEQLGQSENAFQDDNILASVLRRIPNKLTTIEEELVYYEHEWIPGFSSRLSFLHRVYFPIKPLDYSYFTDDSKTEVKNSLNTSEIGFYTRYAHKEKFIAGKVDRISLGSKYPVLQVKYTMGLKGTLSSDFKYHKISAKVSDDFPINPFGWSYFMFETGNIWGKLPFPLLEVHRGNQTLTYDDLAFNLMNYYEFVSDRYALLYYTHHFDGLFLNRIPLLRKLMLRELVSAKAVVGSFRPENFDILLKKDEFNVLSKPYLEAGAGIENILKLVRVDAVWRLSYLDNPDIAKFGIRVSLQISF